MAHFDDVILADRISYGSSFNPQIAGQQVRTISGQIFTNPKDPRTESYITGRIG